jgi:hypothetical protein
MNRRAEDKIARDIGYQVKAMTLDEKLEQRKEALEYLEGDKIIVLRSSKEIAKYIRRNR